MCPKESTDDIPGAAQKVVLVSSAGGHLAELLEIWDAFEGHEVVHITYRSVMTERLDRAYLFENIGTSPWKALRSVWPIFHILRREEPDAVVSTGAEIAVVVFYLAKLLRIRTLFIESWTRVTEPTRTGRLVYPICDAFLVQWPDMLPAYGSKARYRGAIL